MRSFTKQIPVSIWAMDENMDIPYGWKNVWQVAYLLRVNYPYREQQLTFFVLFSLLYLFEFIICCCFFFPLDTTLN